MIGNSAQKKEAKEMFKRSLTNGFLDHRKTNSVLREATAKPRPGLLNILKIYKRLIMQAEENEQVIVETPKKLAKNPSFESEIINKTGARKIIYKENPSLVIGAKIKVGDWIYDASLPTKLKSLKIQ